MRPAHAVLLIIACLGLAACGDIPGPTAGAATLAPEPSGPPPTLDAAAAADAAALGPWRRGPVQPSPALAAAAENACRAQEAVGSLPLAVADARGEGRMVLVFAGPDAAALCHVAVTEDGGTTADARPVAGFETAETPGEGKLGLRDVEVVNDTAGAWTVVVGQVDEAANTVEVSFDADAAWAKTSMRDGWYAIWWPGADRALAVASVDRRNTVIDSYTP